MALASKQPRFTVADYMRLPEKPRFELIEGDFLLAPAPNTWHQAVSQEVQMALYLWVKEHALGVVFPAPTDVVLSDVNVVQPDILFIANDHRRIITKPNIQGAPDFIVEIVSPKQTSRDLIVKKALYEKFAVPEYWVIDPEAETIAVFLLEEGQFKQTIFGKGDVVGSSAVRGFTLDVIALFQAVKF